MIKNNDKIVDGFILELQNLYRIMFVEAIKMVEDALQFWQAGVRKKNWIGLAILDKKVHQLLLQCQES